MSTTQPRARACGRFLPFALDPGRAAEFAPGLYLKRRLRRIVIPYYAALGLAILMPQILVAAVRVFGREASWQSFPTAPDILTHMTFTHLFFPEYWASINGSLWTMSLEMQLHLIFPVLVVVYERYGNRAIIGALGFSIAYRVVVGIWLSGSGFPAEFLGGATGIGRLMEFIAGILAAEIMVKWRPTLTRPRAGLLSLVVVAGNFAATSPMGSIPWIPLRETLLGVTFGALIVLAVTFPAIEKAFGWRPMSMLGYRAYSMFLVHQPVTWYFSEMITKMLGIDDGHLKLAVMWTFGLAIVIVIGHAFYSLIERPCMAWAKATPTTRASSAKAAPSAVVEG